MRKTLLIIILVLAGISVGRTQGQVVPSSPHDVLFVNEGAAAAATTTINATDADSSNARLIGFTYYQAVQWMMVSGTTPRVKIEVWTSMQDVDSTYVLAKTIEDSTQQAAGAWSAVTSLKIAGAYYRKYIITGLATNGVNTVFRMKEYIINLPQDR